MRDANDAGRRKSEEFRAVGGLVRDMKPHGPGCHWASVDYDSPWESWRKLERKKVETKGFLEEKNMESRGNKLYFLWQIQQNK